MLPPFSRRRRSHGTANALGNREVKGVKNIEEETEKQNDWKKGDEFGNKGLWKVKKKNEVTAIMVQRAVGEDSV